MTLSYSQLSQYLACTPAWLPSWKRSLGRNSFPLGEINLLAIARAGGVRPDRPKAR